MNICLDLTSACPHTHTAKTSYRIASVLCAHLKAARTPFCCRSIF